MSRPRHSVLRVREKMRMTGDHIPSHTSLKEHKKAGQDFCGFSHTPCSMGLLGTEGGEQNSLGCVVLPGRMAHPFWILAFGY